MKKVTVLFVLVAAVLVLAQDQALITVKDSSVTSGVIIVTANMGGKALELQCNASTPNCQALKAGKYQMVKLPQNHGMYDCQNADVYELTANPETDQKLGEYCLTEN